MGGFRSIAALAAAAAMVAACGGENGGGNTAGGSNTAAPSTAAAKAAPGETIGQRVAQSGNHATLGRAIKAAGLERTFASAQPYTLFAPTDAAFAKLPGGGANLLEPGARGRLTALLTAHVVPGLVTADDLNKAIARRGGRTQLATVGGATLAVTRQGDALAVTDAAGGTARIAGAEMLGSNGAVHAIDTVLSPR